MSAENQESSSSSAAPAEAGPVEVFVGTPRTEAAPADVTDVVDKNSVPNDPPAGEKPVEAAETDQEDRDEKGRFKPGFQTRIDELTRARREAEREAEYWRVRAQGTDTAKPPAQDAAKSEPPVRENFRTQEEYEDARVDFKVEQRLNREKAETAQLQQVNEKTNTWVSKLEEARKATPDYDTVMNNAELPVANHVAELLFEHDKGAEIAYHFAKNPADLTKINEMGATKAAFRIAEIATSLKGSAPASDPVPTPAKKTTSAPPPARTIGQGRSTTPQLADLSMDDYVKQRKAQGASWAR